MGPLPHASYCSTQECLQPFCHHKTVDLPGLDAATRPKHLLASRGTWCTKSWDNPWWCVKIITALTQIGKVVWLTNFLQMQCYRRKSKLPDHNIGQHNLRQQMSWKHVQDALSSRWSLIWCKGGNKNKEQQQKVTRHLGSKKQTKEEQRGSFWLLKRMWLKGVSRSMTSAAQLVGRSVTGRLIQDAGLLNKTKTRQIDQGDKKKK